MDSSAKASGPRAAMLAVPERPRLRLATGGGYIVDLSPDERWWVKANVEPFRSESRGLQRSLVELFPPFGGDRELPLLQTGIAMQEDVPAIRAVLADLERLDLAQRLTGGVGAAE